MKIALAVASIDGILSLQTGLGVVVQNHISHIENMCSEAQFSAHEFTLFCLSPRLDTDGENFSEAARDLSRDACLATSGELIELESYANGKSWDHFYNGGKMGNHVEQWTKLSHSAAIAVDDIAVRFDRVLVFAHEFFFAAISQYVYNDRIEVIWVPHSQPTDLGHSGRLEFEKRAVNYILRRGDRVGYIGQTMKSALSLTYDVPHESLVPVKNGINPTERRFTVSKIKKCELLSRLKIPSDKRLIFFSGRMQVQKGVDILISALTRFLKSKDAAGYHAVILAPTATTSREFMKTIGPMLEQVQPFATIVTEFEPELPISILTNENLDMVVMPSLVEAMPLVALEALFFAASDVKLIYSPIPAHLEIFSKMPNCFPIPEMTGSGIFSALMVANSCSPTVSNRMRPPTSSENFSTTLRYLIS